MAVSDTDIDAKAVQRAALARLTPGERMQAAMAMADEVKEVTLAGIRLRNPDYDDAAVHRAWMVILHGAELTNKILGPPPAA